MGLLELILVIVLLMWLFGAWVVPVGGSAIHLLLILAVILVVVRVSRGGRL